MTGKWFSPAIPTKPVERQRRKYYRPDTSRRIVLDGIEYPSLTEAAKAMGCSITRIYTLIGEAYRFHGKHTKGV